jgi:hypothetical protein
MLVSSFDTKYSQTATKYEYLDNNFTNLISKDRRFSRIFTSVIENQKLDLSSDIVLRSDMTGQVINTILTHDFKSEHFLYYMGDVFKPDLVNKSIKQYRQHGLEIINRCCAAWRVSILTTCQPKADCTGARQSLVVS